MMPTRNVVRIDGNGAGISATPSSAGSDSTPSLSLSTAAATTSATGGIGSGEGDVVATGQIISATKSDKNEVANDSTKNDAAESQVEEDNTTVCHVTAELVSPSTTGGESSSTKTPRREDFNSALEYLEAKYVKSIVIEDEVTGGGNGQESAVTSTTIEVKTKVFDSDNQMQMEDKSKSRKADLLAERAHGQQSMNDNKSKETCRISLAGGLDGASFESGEKIVERVGNAAETKKKLPVESVVKQSSDEAATCTLVPPFAADDTAANGKTAVSATDESSATESKNNDGSEPSKGAENSQHRLQPPQQQNQNNEVATNGPMMPHQYPQGYGTWPQYPSQSWPFTPPPFGMMYPPYPPPFWGMPPTFVPHIQAQLQPVQGEDNATQTPDARKNEDKRETKKMVKDEVVNTAKSSSSETNSTEIPPLPPLPQLDMTTLVPTNLALETHQDTLDKETKMALDEDSLVERAKLLVKKEMLAEEKAYKKGKELERVLRPPALPPVHQQLRNNFYSRGEFQVAFASHVPQLPSASAVDQSFSSSSSGKEMKVNSDSASLSTTAPKFATAGIPVPALPPFPPFASTVQVPVLPSISALEQSAEWSSKKLKTNFDSARFMSPARLSTFVGKNPLIEGLPGLRLRPPALPPVGDTAQASASAVDPNSDSAQLDKEAIKKAKKELSDSLVEKAKLLVEQEMLAEKKINKKAHVEDCLRPAIAIPVPVVQSPSVAAESTVAQLVSAAHESSSNSSKKRRLTSLHRKVNAFTF